MTPTPQAIENAARKIAKSFGEDPDELAPRWEICGRDNEQLPIWEKYAEQAKAALTGDLGDMVMVPKAALSRLREYKNQIDVIDERGTHDAERVFATVCTMAWPVIDAMLAAAEDPNDQG